MAELIFQIKDDSNSLNAASDLGEKITLICHWVHGYEVKA